MIFFFFQTPFFNQIKPTFILFVIGFLGLSNSTSALNNDGWVFETQGVITASPIIENKVLYCGSWDSTFYALNTENGKLIWSYKGIAEIKSQALLCDDAVIYNSKYGLVALNKKNGSLLWKYKHIITNDTLPSPIDEWDYHASAPLLHKDSIYYGDDYGTIHVVNKKTGMGRKLISLKSKAAIHSDLTIDEGILYFGDWNGYIHAYNLSKEQLQWSHKSFTKKPYASYGSIITKPITHKERLYVGARNYDFTVLNKHDGSIVWQYHEPEGGWITGTPLIINDTLFMGGSDNKAMTAFNALTGEVYWICNTHQNIFCKPIYKNGKLIFVDGDSYNHTTGEGYLYVADSFTGEILNEIKIGRNCYSSPILNEKYLYFGSFDKSIHAVPFH